MNTYHKYYPNVYLAKCAQKHAKGDVITVTTKYGKENPSQVHNLIFEKDGFFYYSITREDGFNVQEHAKRKGEVIQDRAECASKKASEYWEKTRKDAGFLTLGEPIKVGHHSEKRHRKAIEDVGRNSEKAVEHMRKADAILDKADYWKERESIINLSMPESIDFFKHKLEEATAKHAGLKSGEIERRHSYSLQYANKEKKEAQKHYDLAVKLWGDLKEAAP